MIFDSDAGSRYEMRSIERGPMTYDTLRYEVKDAIATITLDRPEAYNAIDLKLDASS